jgi:hypothetical protein
MQPLESFRRNIRGVAYAASVAVFGLSAVGQPAAAAPRAGWPQASSQQTAAAPQAEVDAAGGGIIDRVLLRVSGRAILYSDFEARL